MKVMHIITRFIRGGAQENTLLTIDGLVKRGFDVSLVTGPALGPEGDLLEDARKTGAKIILVDQMRRAICPWRDLSSYFALRKIIREEKPEIVHTHSSKAGILARCAAHAEKVPYVVHGIHGLPFHDYERWILNKAYIAAEKFCARYTDLYICVADAMTDKTVAAGVAPREKFVTIYSGMDAEAFAERFDGAETRLSLGIPLDKKVVGVVARISPLKGHEFIIKAAPGIVARHPDMHMLFVGDGHIYREMRELAQKLGVLDRITFAGLQPWKEIPRMLSAMDVVAHTSLREGLARVLPQALLAGVPVVSYDVDGAKEVVIPGRTGWLVPPESINGLAEAVSEVLSDLPAARAKAEEGRRLCLTMFPADVMVDAIVREYEKLTGAVPAGVAR